MAPLLHLLLAFALSSAVFASPHVSRNVHNHRAIARAPIDVRADSVPAVPLPKRKRSLNKRCVSSPSNSTTPAVLSSTPAVPSSTPAVPSSTPALPSSTYSAPMNVALPPSSSSPSSSPPPPAESPTTPTPTPTSTTTTSSPAQTPTSSSGSGEPSFMSSPQSGSGTWYDTGLGACGITNNNNQFIAAAAFGMFDNFPNYAGVNPNDNPICGLNVIVYYGGNQVTVTLTDRCAGCTDPTSLDLSPAAFQVLAPLSVGRISITWDWSL